METGMEERERQERRMKMCALAGEGALGMKASEREAKEAKNVHGERI